MKIILLIIFSTSVFALSTDKNELSGIWHTGEDNTIIETYEKAGAWYGKLLSSDNPKAKIGTNILRGFEKKGDMWKGKIYAAKRDKILDAEIVPSDSKLNITVFTGLFEKKLEWKKVTID